MTMKSNNTKRTRIPLIPIIIIIVVLIGCRMQSKNSHKDASDLDRTAISSVTDDSNVIKFNIPEPLQTVSNGEYSGQFSDVSPDLEYYSAVNWCVEAGILSGEGGYLFHPDEYLTRAMLATMLFRADGSPSVEGSINFSDVKENTWYTDAIIWADENNIMKGYGNGLFGTEDTISMDRVDAVLSRYLGSEYHSDAGAARTENATRATGAMVVYEALKDKAFVQLDNNIDLYNGEGVLRWDNGDVFSGTWTNGELTRGTYAFSNGSFYSGTYKNNRCSEGIFDFGESCSERGYNSYKAVIKDGNVNTIIFEMISGITYEGNITGKASIQYSCLDRYEGDVIDGSRDGEGKYIWADGAYYEGKWENGKMSGKGNYHYTSSEYPYISGEFVNNKPDGKATYFKEEGNTFDTKWSNGSCTSITES